MGVYNKKEGTHNERPYYVIDTGNRYLYYSDRGDWRVGDTLGSRAARIKTTETGLNEIPLGAGGWEYYDGGKWTSDPKITVSVLGIR